MIKWYVLFTKHHHEGKVKLQVESRNIETYLPTYSSLRVWKDRKVWRDIPVFPNYLFIHCDLSNYLSELKRMRSVIRIVGHPFPESIPDFQIDSIRQILTCSNNWDYLNELAIGQEVLIIKGALKGVRGILIEKRNSYHLAVQINLINNGVIIVVKPDEIRPIEKNSLLPCSIINPEEVKKLN